MRKLSQDSEQETLSTYVDGAHSNECEDVDASLVLAFVEVLDTDIESCADVPSAKINGVDACDYHVAKVGCCQSCRTSGVRRELSAAAGELRRGRALQTSKPDTDSDGIADVVTVDTDSDGIADVTVDTDSDGIADVADPDSGGDSIPDAEGGAVVVAGYTECDDWDPTGFHATCAEGFDGVVTIGPCSSAGLPYRLSGCVPSPPSPSSPPMQPFITARVKVNLPSDFPDDPNTDLKEDDIFWYHPETISWSLACDGLAEPITGGAAYNRMHAVPPDSTCTLSMYDSWGDGWLAGPTGHIEWSAPGWAAGPFWLNSGSSGSATFVAAPSCTAATGDGRYLITAHPTRLALLPEWNHTGFDATCAEGFDGVVTIAPCSAVGLPYRLSGCVATGVEVTTGPCSITDGGLCVASPNYPNPYVWTSGCTVTNVPPMARLRLAPMLYMFGNGATNKCIYGYYIDIGGRRYCGDYRNLPTDFGYCTGVTSAACEDVPSWNQNSDGTCDCAVTDGRCGTVWDRFSGGCARDGANGRHPVATDGTIVTGAGNAARFKARARSSSPSPASRLTLRPLHRRSAGRRNKRCRRSSPQTKRRNASTRRPGRWKRRRSQRN